MYIFSEVTANAEVYPLESEPDDCLSTFSVSQMTLLIHRINVWTVERNLFKIVPLKNKAL